MFVKINLKFNNTQIFIYLIQDQQVRYFLVETVLRGYSLESTHIYKNPY